MRPALIAGLVVVAAAVHYSHGSPGGGAAYVFFAALLVVSGIYSRGMRGQNYWLSLTGLVEAWFVFDYCAYGTALCVLGRSKAPLPESLDQAYGRAYWVGTAAFVAFGVGAHLAALRPAGSGTGGRGPGFRYAARWVFRLFVWAGVLSFVVLMFDGETREQMFYAHVGLAPREGMGRYTSLLFMLPTTAVGLWYLNRRKRRYSRAVTMAALFLLAAIHLGFGRRLMWAATMLMIFHLLKVRGIFVFRPRYLVAAVPVMVLASVWMEASKNLGWYTAVERVNFADLADGNKVLDMVDNSVGRFDATAALISNRETLPFYYGETFLMAPLQVLPVSAGMERSRGVREELGELIYGAFGRGLVSQEASLVGELYANFGYAGVMGGFLGVGFFAAWLDARCHHSRSPMVAVGYGLCLFRVVHQLATAATSWFPLTFLAFVPWVAAVGVAKVWRRQECRRSRQECLRHGARVPAPRPQPRVRSACA